jgi:quercetin dioxygenase-like cupin family protein
MKVERFTDTTSETVEGVPGVTVRWVIGEKDAAPNFAMRVFDVEPGASTPYHTHPWEHEVYILEGAGVVNTASGEKPFEKGHIAYVAPDEEHQFVNKGEDVLRFICVIPHVNA